MTFGSDIVPKRLGGSIAFDGHIVNHEKHPTCLQPRLQGLISESALGAGLISLRLRLR